MENNDDPILFCEKHFPETIAMFKKIQQEDLLTFCKKNMDYGSNNISMGTSLKEDSDILFSLGAINIRINDKVQRLLNLINKSRQAQNEAIEDSYKDLSVYGIIARIVTNHCWGK